MDTIALVIVDMQNYYLNEKSDYYKFCTLDNDNSLFYIKNRVYNTVIPNIQKLIAFFRKNNSKIIYLKLVSKRKDRKDLLKVFLKFHNLAKEAGYPNLYPYKTDFQANVLKEIHPEKQDRIFEKTTFSAFTSTNINEYLTKMGIKTLAFTGIATSQCVETTARDAADRNFSIVHIEDGQADYEESSHTASIYAQRGVCGHMIVETDYFINNSDLFMREL